MHSLRAHQLSAIEPTRNDWLNRCSSSAAWPAGPQNWAKEFGQIWDNREEMNELWKNEGKLIHHKGIGVYIYWNLSKVRCKSNPSLTESMTNSRCMPVPMPTVPRLFCCFTPLKKHGYGSVHWAHILETWRVHTNNQSCYKTHTTVIDSVSWVFIPSILIVQVPGNSLSNCGHATCCQSPRIPPPLTAAAVQAIAPGRPPTLGPVSTPSSLA